MNVTGRESKGCICRVTTMPEHNPRPRSVKGKARHEARSPEDKKRVEQLWLQDRTNRTPTKGRAYSRRSKS